MIAILLAGGHASRLGGGDKGARHVGGRPILDRVVAAMRRQCESLVLSANGDPARFADTGATVVADASPDRLGPLAGILAGLDHIAATRPDTAFALSVPTDTPFLPDDLVARLEDRRVADRAAIVCAGSGGRPHYTIALWALDLRDDIRRALSEGDRKLERLYGRHPFAVVDWPMRPVDPFFNVNTPEDLAEAERLAARL